jgi:hypothetical protein
MQKHIAKYISIGSTIILTVASLIGLPENFNSDLYCRNNELTSLPELPKSLTTLYCSNNEWTEPLSFDIVQKFEIDPYTFKQIRLFNSYEFKIKHLKIK